MKILDDLYGFMNLRKIKKDRRLYLFYWDLFENETTEAEDLVIKVKKLNKNIDKELDKTLQDLNKAIKKANLVYMKLAKYSPKQ